MIVEYIWCVLCFVLIGFGVLVYFGVDCRMVVEYWLVLVYFWFVQVWQEWMCDGVVLLFFGMLLFVVCLFGELVFVVVGCCVFSLYVDEFLVEVFDGGLVICDLCGLCYYVLVFVSMLCIWYMVVEEWWVDDVDCFGRYCYFGVLWLDCIEFDLDMYGLYWLVFMVSVVVLCVLFNVVWLIVVVVYQWCGEWQFVCCFISEFWLIVFFVW